MMFSLKPLVVEPFEGKGGIIADSFEQSATASVAYLHNKKQKTVLQTKEVEDNEIDYLKIDSEDFSKLSVKEASLIYTKLLKYIKVIFTGSADPQINRIDYKKVVEQQNNTFHNHHHTTTSLHNGYEEGLIEQLKICREQIENKKMLYGLWDIEKC